MISRMNSTKAIIAGIIFIIVATLLIQLAYLFVAVGYNSLEKDYPFLKEISGIFRYLIAIPVFIGVMFVGGYITAAIAKSKTLSRTLMHCMVVGVVTIGGTMWLALENANLTLTGIIVNTLMMLATIAGGLWFRKTAN